ncbi:MULTISPECIES: PilX N-terminal domain-containing pilus assembly protein [unclassified Uliginosibacterium]|uniref:pilus assembly PilX family protein n=1 Tax=unclassified Uliginosibacterium TaxID=2621521 RepID=UPI000C7AD550|nr:MULTISPECIES: PilX N-terminal domain-containing pilus assembly protein [unclassified Uliginosibacterium]MDO6384680.1 PilX N-terminal domain-containing pilus assembly protein [Uliginosibacterium sp. 31-12]PLK48397.1 hypothetical protein C0V76_09965 [Uliginosibacterium sp. TH139]
MSYFGKKEQGLSLIVSLVLLLALTILVLSATRTGTLGERITGNHMDRSRAYQAAEQALSQAQAALTANGEACMGPCTSIPNTGIGAASAANTVPSAWSDTDSKEVTLATGQGTSAKFVINALTPASSFVPTGKESCLPYSIMGKGQGLNSNSVVILQAISFVCPM